MLAVWEKSVRSSHHFLSPEQIDALKPLVPEAFEKTSQLAGVRNDAEAITGFVGVEDSKLEMLFIHPSSQGKGYGSALVEHAKSVLGATLVDVNEGNVDAIQFYESLGAKLMGRSETDDYGNPYPLLHYAL